VKASEGLIWGWIEDLQAAVALGEREAFAAILDLATSMAAHATLPEKEPKLDPVPKTTEAGDDAPEAMVRVNWSTVITQLRAFADHLEQHNA
jgi:hypothetical protein